MQIIRKKEFFELVKANADKLILCGDVVDLWRCPIEKIKSQEPMRITYETLLSAIEEVPTAIIWGNHNSKLWK